MVIFFLQFTTKCYYTADEQQEMQVTTLTSFEF